MMFILWVIIPIVLCVVATVSVIVIGIYDAMQDWKRRKKWQNYLNNHKRGQAP